MSQGKLVRCSFGDISEGELLKRITDCGKSAGLVDDATNQLVWASQEVEKTSGRSRIEMLTRYADLNALWTPEDFEPFRQQLQAAGQLSGHAYPSHAWELQDGVYRRVRRQFQADHLELVEIAGRTFRLSLGVEVVA